MTSNIATTQTIKTFLESNPLQEIADKTGISLSTLKNYRYGRTSVDDMPVSLVRKLSELCQQNQTTLKPGKYLLDGPSWAYICDIKKRNGELALERELYAAYGVLTSGQTILIDLSYYYDRFGDTSSALDIERVIDFFVMCGNIVLINEGSLTHAFTNYTNCKRITFGHIPYYSERASQMLVDLLILKDKTVSREDKCIALEHLKQELDLFLYDSNLNHLTCIYKDKEESNPLGYNPIAVSKFVHHMRCAYPTTYCEHPSKNVYSAELLNFAPYPSTDSKAYLVEHFDQQHISIELKQEILEVIESTNVQSCEDFLNRITDSSPLLDVMRINIELSLKEGESQVS